jgi:preprotein translocase subunit SecG
MAAGLALRPDSGSGHCAVSRYLVGQNREEERAAMVIGVSIILIITSLVMVLLVLLHKGKGGGLSDMFGGGVSSTLGSSSVVERNLDRITVFFGVLWFVCIIGLGLLINH